MDTRAPDDPDPECQTAGHTLFSSADGHTIWAGLDEDGRLWGWDGTPVPEAKKP
jgi:hypothetical protein